jgi:hypothetical protein
MSRTRFWRALAALALVAMSLGLTAGRVAAASVTATPDTVGPTDSVLLSGQGFVPNDTVTVAIVGPSGGVSALTYPTDGAGQFGGPISLAQGSARPGVYKVTATGTKTAFTAMTTFTVRAPDPAAVLAAFDAALNAGDADAALALFADDAVVRSQTAVYTGKEEIGRWLRSVVDQHIRIELIGGRRVDGDTETHSARVSVDDLRRLGVTLEGTAESVVREGKIRTYSFSYTPESLARLQAAQARAQGAAPPPPVALPRTGGGALGFVAPVPDE